MADIIYIRDLKINTTIGIFNWEQHIKQPVLFNLELATDIRSCAKSQNISDTVDYFALIGRIEEYVSQRTFSLVEVLAEQLADLLLEEFNLKKIRLSVSKLNILPNLREVGVTIERP